MADNKCKNPECGREIEVMAFKGTGSCSVDCRKAQGIDYGPKGNMVFLTNEEERLIKEARQNG